MKRIALLLSLMTLAATTAHAGIFQDGPTAPRQVLRLEERPFLDPSRGQLAAGFGYDFYSRGSEAATDVNGFKKEFTVGLYGSWNLVEELDLAGATVFGLDNHVFRSHIGIRYTMWAGMKGVR
jgi:hypothetical protein